MEKIIELVLPYMISILEIIGILVVFISSIYSFIKYIQNFILKKDFNLIHYLGKHLAMGLEFKMAAEILKTVLIQSLEELFMLGAVILLRAILSLLIHFEMRPHKNDKHKSNNEINSVEIENKDDQTSSSETVA